MKWIAFLLLISFHMQLRSTEVTLDSAEAESDALDLLDCACSVYNNPLKAIERFTLIIPHQSPESEIIVQGLEKLGSVKKFSLSDPKGIHFEPMATGARLLFTVTPLEITAMPSSSITRLSLSLSMSVEILKTKQRVDAYVWTTNIFSLKNHQDAASKLIQQFINSYKEANPSTAPLFYVYQ